jgi:HSP20 family protein
MAKKASKELAKTEPATRFPVTWDMDRLFEDFFRRSFGPSVMPRLSVDQAEFNPAIDIYEEKNDVVVKAELPGIKKEDIDITLDADTITIAGEKKTEHKTEKKNIYRYESSYGSFCRTMPLPAEVQGDKVKAAFKDGILEIRLPKTEEAKKKQRKVKIS